MLHTLPDNSSAQDIAHYLRRAREERELASKAITSRISDAHLRRARGYETLVSRAQAAGAAPWGAAEYENSNFTMSSQKLFPFLRAAGSNRPDCLAQFAPAEARRQF